VAEESETLRDLRSRSDLSRQRLYPVADEDGGLAGVIPRQELIDLTDRGSMHAGEVAQPPRVTVHPDNTLRELARLFASEHVTTAVVLSRDAPHGLAGLIAVEDLLQGHLRDLQYERQRERVLHPRVIPVVRRGVDVSARAEEAPEPTYVPPAGHADPPDPTADRSDARPRETESS